MPPGWHSLYPLVLFRWQGETVAKVGRATSRQAMAETTGLLLSQMGILLTMLNPSPPQLSCAQHLHQLGQEYVRTPAILKLSRDDTNNSLSAGIMRTIDQKSKVTDETLNKAFSDLRALMDNAKEMVNRPAPCW